MIKYRESTLNWPPNCPKNGVHLLDREARSFIFKPELSI